MPVTVVYCEGWDPASRAPFGVMPEASARDRDRAGTQYAVLLRTAAGPVALLQVAWARGYLGIYQFDARARRTRQFDFRVLDDPSRLRWHGFSHWLLESPQDAEFNGDSWRFEVTIGPDGRAWQDFEADKEGMQSTQWELPENLRTIGRAAFGNWQAYPGTGTGTGEELVVEPDPPAAAGSAGGPRWDPPAALRPVNIEALFTEGARLRIRPEGESEGKIAVVREPYQAGLLRLPTGQVVAGDPFWLELPEPFTVTVPPGTYPVSIAWVGWVPGPGENVAAVHVLISDDPVATWEMALLPGQDPRMLDDDSFYGFGVDSGIGAFADADGREALPESLQERYGIDDPFPDAPAPECFAMWAEDPASGTNMLVYPAGEGDGEYPVWVGRTDDGRVASLVADMLLFHDAELLSPPLTPATKYVSPGSAGTEAGAALPPAGAGEFDNLAAEIVARADDIKASVRRLTGR